VRISTAWTSRRKLLALVDLAGVMEGATEPEVPVDGLPVVKREHHTAFGTRESSKDLGVGVHDDEREVAESLADAWRVGRGSAQTSKRRPRSRCRASYGR
jgi:hypothetical protein